MIPTEIFNKHPRFKEDLTAFMIEVWEAELQEYNLSTRQMSVDGLFRYWINGTLTNPEKLFDKWMQLKIKG